VQVGPERGKNFGEKKESGKYSKAALKRSPGKDKDGEIGALEKNLLGGGKGKESNEAAGVGHRRGSEGKRNHYHSALRGA